MQAIITALSGPDNYRNEIIVTQLDNLKTFVSSEQTRINDNPERPVPYVSFALSFFPPPPNAHQILHGDQAQDAPAHDAQRSFAVDEVLNDMATRGVYRSPSFTDLGV